MNKDQNQVQNPPQQEQNPLVTGQVRRSGRCRTVNSIYADSIDQLKRSIVNSIPPSKKISHKSSINEIPEVSIEDDQSEICEQYRKAEIMQDRQVRVIEVCIIAPKKLQRRLSRISKQHLKSTRTTPTTFIPYIKRKASNSKTPTNKQPTKSQNQEPKSLLNIMLNAVMKVQEESESQSQYQQKSLLIDNQSQYQSDKSSQNSYQKLLKKRRNRLKQSQQKIKVYKKEESNKKIARLETNFLRLQKKYREIRPKVMATLYRLE